LVAACRISVEKAGLEPGEADWIRALLEQYELPVRLPKGVPVEGVMKALRADKKFEEGKIRFVVCPRLGEAVVSTGVTEADMAAAVRALA